MPKKPVLKSLFLGRVCEIAVFFKALFIENPLVFLFQVRQDRGGHEREQPGVYPEHQPLVRLQPDGLEGQAPHDSHQSLGQVQGHQ